jgi:inosine-uridine nucleoside N-ribohydrolase
MISIIRIHTAPVPTILDTDIGSDYDDQMALTYILSNPTIFDLKLVICSTFNTTARGQVAAKTLAIFGRFDVALAIGQNTGSRDMPEYEWAQNYTLDQFQTDGGTVYQNGEEALLKELQKATPDNIYNVIEISPETSLGHVIQSLPPDTVKCIRLFAMAGSIYRGYNNSSVPSKEYNVVIDIPAAQTVFNSSWAYFGLAPLDTTIFLQLNGPEWQTFCSFYNQSKHVQLVIDSYTIWYNNGGKNYTALQPFSPETGTSTMHDVLAAFLAASYPRVFTMVNKELPLVVTGDGLTAVNSTLGKSVNASVDFLTPDPYTAAELISITVLDSIIYSK